MSCYFEQSDCFKFVNKLETGTVNLIYIDPPFGTTQQDWDSKLDWKKLFGQFFRVLRDDGMLVIHCSLPFTYELIRSAPKPPLYHWIWNKGGSPTGYLSANHQPLRCCEEILVWKKKKTTYYRQQIGDEERESHTATPSGYTNSVAPRKKTVLKGKTRTHYLQVPRCLDGFSTRPREIVELMIQSYSKEGDTVMDCFCYKGLSGTVCKALGRKWIGSDKYFLPLMLF